MIEQSPWALAAASGPVLVPEAMVLVPPLGSFVLFRSLPAALPEGARAMVSGREHAMRALVWEAEAGRAALVLFASVTPTLGFTLLGPGSAQCEVTMARSISGEPADVARFLVEAGAPPAATVDFLIGADDPDAAAARALHGLLGSLAAPGGVIELACEPETGGILLQGWTTTPLAGPCRIVTAAGLRTAAAAPFARDDVLAPATGLCLYAHGLPEAPDPREAVLVVGPAGVLRLTPLSGMTRLPDPAAGTRHVRAMLDRLPDDDAVTAPFQRICRPRYPGTDTLSAHPGPVAAALDCALQAPSGDLFLSGWLLDPLHQVDRILVKSTAGLYARIDDRWHPTQRPDLIQGFAADPRFVSCLDPRETMHGFLVYVPGGAGAEPDAEIYLELVLAGGECLFRPLAPARCRDGSAWPAILAQVPRQDPALATVLGAHVAPFVARLSGAQTGPAPRLHPLGTAAPDRGLGKPVVALMPLSQPRLLEPVLAALSDTADAAELDLVLVADDTMPANFVAGLDDCFRFYGVTGAVALVRPHLTAARRLDLVVAATEAPALLIWGPAALPKRPGWLAALRRAAATLPGCALVSPVMTCEDGTLHVGGARVAAPADRAICHVAGFARDRQALAAPTRVSAGAAELALVDRGRLEAAGGLCGRMLGEAHVHHDLGRRLGAAGGTVWFTPEAEFWMLGRAAAATGPSTAIEDQLDAALLALAAGAASEIRPEARITGA